MPRKSISFELDFMIKDILPKFTVKQFDDISFNIKPKNQGLDYNAAGMTGKIFIGINNDVFMQTTGITVSSNNINVLLNRNMLQKNGRAYAEIELSDSAGVITSSSFIFDIDSKIGEGATIPGSIEGFVAKYERLISEFKSQVNETISNCNANVDNKLNTVDSLINVKISDFEKRFNRLTSSQQQDAEVIDARTDFKGVVFDNLKERIDYTDKLLRDSTVSTVTTESDFTTVEATSNGYFEDVKLEGKTLVNKLEGKGVFPFLLTSETTTTRTIFKDTFKFIEGNTYTFIINVSNLSNTNSSALRIDTSSGNGVYTLIQLHNGVNIVKFENVTTSLGNLWLYFPANSEASCTINSIVILEGDHTQNPPSYFEGLKSVGDGADEIVVSSVKGDGNLFDESLLSKYITPTDANEYTLNYTTMHSNNFIHPVNGDGQYTFSYICKETVGNKNPRFIFKYDDDSIENINSVTSNGFTRYSRTSNANKKLVGIKVAFSGAGGNWIIQKDSIILNKGTIPKPYTPHQADKKRLLYYNNETQTWEKPILRQWDSIEKHANGKYYYHQRSGEVVLNGSETWTNYNSLGACTPYLVEIPKINYNHAPISDKFVGSIFDGRDEEKICVGGSPHIIIQKANSTLSTQNVAGFKQWLQANNVTVVYQLAQEKVYECTNIDLITYANETNYIVESGVIVPKTTLKVHNNISNVVSLLQKKVSLLESNIKASQEVQGMMILETDMRMLDIELALMEFIPMTLNLGGSGMLRSATYFNFLKNHIINETYEKEYLENVMNKYLATGRINQEEYDELYKMLYPPVYDIELPIEY